LKSIRRIATGIITLLAFYSLLLGTAFAGDVIRGSDGLPSKPVVEQAIDNSSSADSDKIPGALYVSNKQVLFLNYAGDNTANIGNTGDSGYSMFAKLFNDQDFSVEEKSIGVITQDSLTGYDAVILTWLKSKTFSTEESNTIFSYAQQGGNVLLIGEHGLYSDTWNNNFNVFGEKFGVTTAENFLEDQNNYQENEYWPIISDFKNHAITNGLRKIVYIAGSSLNLDDAGTGIAFTSSVATPAGRQPIIAATEINQGRFVTTCDSNLFNNKYIEFQDNKMLVENIVKWLAEADYGPLPPTNFKATKISLGFTIFNLTWNPTQTPNVSKYNLYWSINPEYGFVRIAEDITATKIQVFPGNEQTCYFAVTAVDENGNESEKSEVVKVDLKVPGNGFKLPSGFGNW